MTRALLGLRRRHAKLRLGVTTAEGFRIPYLQGGPEQGHGDIVFVHGFSDTKDSFVDVARVLARTHRVTLLDLPGFSEASQPWDFRYTVPAIASVVAAALKHLGVQRAHVVGNSLGGAIGAQYTLRYPDRVRTLTLIGAAGLPMAVSSAWEQAVAAGNNPFVVERPEQWAEFIELVLHKPPFMPGPVRRHLARVFVARAALNEKIFADLVDDAFDLSGRLAEIHAPTLAVWGSRDRVMDVSIGRRFHAGIAGSRLVILDEIGHCPQVEAPARTARLVADHIDANRESS